MENTAQPPENTEAKIETPNTSPPAEPFLAKVTISDGREITVHRFQARDFVRARNKAGRAGLDGTAIMTYLVGSIISCDGKLLETEEAEDLEWPDTLRLIGEMGEPEGMSNEQRNGKLISGNLPSGKSIEIKKPSTREALRAMEIHPKDKDFALVCHCCKIDGVQPDIHDVRIMDGFDYMVIAGELNTPS